MHGRGKDEAENVKIIISHPKGVKVTTRPLLIPTTILNKGMKKKPSKVQKKATRHSLTERHLNH
jgi:hypothetical protein